MVDKLLREPKEYVLLPLARRLMASIHPTTLTITAFSVGLAAGLAIWWQAYTLGLVLWLINRLLDGLDGTVARTYGKQTDFGGYLDILLDTAIYALLPTALTLSAPSPLGYGCLVFLLSSFYVNGASWMYLAALLEKRKQGTSATGELTTITMPTGLVEGAETVVFYTLFLLFPAASPLLFGLMALLVYVTVVQRLLWALRFLRL